MQLATYFAALARYHAWATQRLLDALVPVSDEVWHRDAGLFFRSIHGTVNHLLLTDQIWFGRFARGESVRLALDTELHAGRDAVTAALTEAVACWAPWVAGLDTARLDSELRYMRNNGEEVRVPFAPTLGHVFNHATHHRGQVSAALTTAGQPAPELDWVALLRLETPAP